MYTHTLQNKQPSTGKTSRTLPRPLHAVSRHREAISTFPISISSFQTAAQKSGHIWAWLRLKAPFGQNVFSKGDSFVTRTNCPRQYTSLQPILLRGALNTSPTACRIRSRRGWKEGVIEWCSWALITMLRQIDGHRGETLHVPGWMLAKPIKM